MKKLILCVILIPIIVNVNGQLRQFYKVDYSGSASWNNNLVEITHVITGNEGSNVLQVEFRFWEPFSYGSTGDHNIQGIPNFYVTPSPDNIISDGNRKTYIWDNINMPEFTITKSFWANTDVNLGPGFYYHDIYPVSSVPNEYLVATDSIQADHWSIESMALNLTSNISDNKIYDAVTEIAKFIVSEIKYKTGGGTPQDAVSVLDSHEGDCKGQSQLMVAMLRSLGIPAAVVGGYMLRNPYNLPLPPGNDPISAGGNQGRHAIIQVYYPSVNKWVQGDPQGFVHFYDQNFVVNTKNSPDDITHTWMHPICGDGCDVQQTWTSGQFSWTTNNYQYKDHSVFYGNKMEDGNLLVSAYKYDPVTGIGDKITIEDPPGGLPDNTYAFFLDDELSFYGNFHSASGATLKMCYWSIDLYHSAGEFELLAGQSLELWQPTTPTSIPAYNWANWIESDDIYGKVKVLCELSDGDFVYDDHHIRLTNECAPTLFENQTVNSNQTVDYCHTVLRDIVVNGATLTIISEKAVVEDNVTVQNGAKLIINANQVQIDKNFEVEIGSELIIE